MIVTIAFALLPFMQIEPIVAAETSEQLNLSNEGIANRTMIVEEPDYYGIFPTASRRFKVLMSLMVEDGFRPELLEFASEKMKDVIKERMDSWEAEILADKERQDGDLKGTKVVSGRIPPPEVLRQNLEMKEQLLDSIYYKMDECREALKEAGKSISKIFENLFKDYARPGISQPQQNVASREPQVNTESSTNNVNTAVQGTNSPAEYVVKQYKNENDYINLRFVMPSFSEDLLSLHKAIQNIEIEKQQDSATLKDVIMSWAQSHLPKMELKDEIDGITIKKELEMLYDTYFMYYIVTSFREHNILDTNVNAAVVKCKNMNAASFGTMGLLLAAVIAFTMW
ncbi:hypothetical protein BBBOND_0206210 [Babesia bigemina]|uniref:Uncharacterized protein n=1 Tax=Babesia bigemina TaxID=5866 RepID=A0A061D4F7_BABBI|nr:hypothetical protein BBBOND_0206210 [Babesia bigemina]CDR95463.1 hypothetical protein BBBOND_0206210 [Babesia bigemina]|eukprot:XP_012767649.1 hypothetical protein BBBOND_0206210 [Babesia bigemina]